MVQVPENYKLVCMSINNLEQRTAETMERDPRQFGFIVAPFEEGFFVSCNRPDGIPEQEADSFGYSHFSLRQCRLWAHDNGYQYIMFDRDADAAEALPTYSW